MDLHYLCRKKYVGMTNLYLVRHGQTVDNVNQIMQGQTQGQLTEEGERQALQLREELAGKQMDAYLSSDLKRSVDTCRIIAGERSGEIAQTQLLRERDWGGFTGRFIPDLKDEAWPDDIEPIEDLRRRARQFLDFVRKRYPGKNVLAVGHGIINKAIQAAYHQKAMQEIPRMANAEVRLLKL